MMMLVSHDRSKCYFEKREDAASCNCDAKCEHKWIRKLQEIQIQTATHIHAERNNSEKNDSTFSTNEASLIGGVHDRSSQEDLGVVLRSSFADLNCQQIDDKAPRNQAQSKTERDDELISSIGVTFQDLITEE